MQRAIQKEFTESTLLCIAHRLATIVSAMLFGLPPIARPLADV